MNMEGEQTSREKLLKKDFYKIYDRDGNPVTGLDPVTLEKIELVRELTEADVTNLLDSGHVVRKIENDKKSTQGKFDRPSWIDHSQTTHDKE
jgi:hypothetical protein